MAINERREKEVRKTNCDQRKIYNKKAKEILHINNFKTQIKELYKKMNVKIEETSEFLDGIRDWHKLGVKMDHTIKDIAKNH